MGEMSSIVSRRPPFSVSTSQANDFFWMSIRFGTSSDLSSRANVRRMRGASIAAKAATPGELRASRAGVRSSLGAGEDGATHQDSTGRCEPLFGALGAHGPRPARLPYVAGRAEVDGCDYRPSGGKCSRSASGRQPSDRVAQHVDRLVGEGALTLDPHGEGRAPAVA